ncbi:hypothetical protein TNCV_997011 [Trichonephila clavipes]|nr:hypothetical protein TNCV_997011 [Trichonephila clavipes]
MEASISGVKGSPRNRLRDPKCPSSRRLRIVREDTGVPSEGATCTWMAADEEVHCTRERNTEFHYAFKEGKDAQGNLTASCKRLISWFLLYKETELGRKIVPVRPPKF